MTTPPRSLWIRALDLLVPALRELPESIAWPEAEADLDHGRPLLPPEERVAAPSVATRDARRCEHCGSQLMPAALPA